LPPKKVERKHCDASNERRLCFCECRDIAGSVCTGGRRYLHASFSSSHRNRDTERRKRRERTVTRGLRSSGDFKSAMCLGSVCKNAGNPSNKAYLTFRGLAGGLKGANKISRCREDLLVRPRALPPRVVHEGRRDLPLYFASGPGPRGDRHTTASS